MGFCPTDIRSISARLAGGITRPRIGLTLDGTFASLGRCVNTRFGLEIRSRSALLVGLDIKDPVGSLYSGSFAIMVTCDYKTKKDFQFFRFVRQEQLHFAPDMVRQYIQDSYYW